MCPFGRISPSDGDSVVSDHSSERESTEENRRGHATPSNGKHSRKVPINVLNGEQPWQRSSNSDNGSRKDDPKRVGGLGRPTKIRATRADMI